MPSHMVVGKVVKKIQQLIFTAKKNPKKLASSLGFVVLALFIFIYNITNFTKANANLSKSPSGSNAMFVNINPKFKAEFGDKSNPIKPTVKFSALPSDYNPITGESVLVKINTNIIDNIVDAITPNTFNELDASTIEFSLSQAKVDTENASVEISSNTEPADVSTTQNLNNLIENSMNDKLATLEQSNVSLKDKISSLKSEINSLINDSKDIFASTDLIEEKDKKDYVLNKGILPGVDVKYSIKEGKGVKEEIVIQKLPSYDAKCYENVPFGQISKLEELCDIPKNQYIFDLKLDKDVKVNRSITTTRNNPVPVWYFTDYYGKYLAHIESPFAYDSKNNLTNSVSIEINENKLILTVDLLWLLDPERTYPITIDPNIIHDTQSEFAAGTLNRVKDVGSTENSPQLQTYYQELPADEHTVGLWHLNEGVGTTVIDKSGNNYTGTFGTGTSSPTWATGTGPLLGSAAVTFDGNDYISSASIPSFAQGTMEAWIKPSGSDYTTSQAVMGGLAASGADATARHLISALESSTCSAQWYTVIANGTTSQVACSGQTYSSANFPGGTWTHLAVTYDGIAINFYRDGVLIGSTQQSVSGAGSAEIFSIGRLGAFTGGYEYNGTIDEVRISDIARTPEEIKASAQRRPDAIYTSGVVDLTASFNSTINSMSWTEPGVTTGNGETVFDSTSLVAHWTFNDTSGPTLLNVAGSCGSSCNGTLTDFSSTASQDPTITGSTQSGWTNNNKLWGGGALMFDGTDDYVQISDTQNLRPSGSFSVELWQYKTRRTANSTPISKITYGTSGYMFYEEGVTDLRTYFFMYGLTPLNVVDTINTPLNEWLHYVGVYDSSLSKLQLYRNGILVKSTNVTGTPTHSTDPFRIGRYANEINYFAGIVDSLRIYSSALSASEILSNYNAGNIEFQTRSGTATEPDFSSWEEWRPVTGVENILENFDVYETSPENYKTAVYNINTNNYWYKINNSTEPASNTTGTQGRLPQGTSGTGDATNAYHADFIKDNDIYRMMYSGYTANVPRLYSATSPDALTWSKVDNSIPTASDTSSTNGRIPLGTNTTGDDAEVVVPNLWKEGSTYTVFYGGFDGTNYRIYSATSPDGLTWQKVNNATPTASNGTSNGGRIALGTNTTGDDTHVLPGDIIQTGGTYTMIYGGHDGATWRMYSATSPDLINWGKVNNTTPSASNTIGTNGRIPTGGSGTADVSGSLYLTVVKEGNLYKGWYNGLSGVWRAAIEVVSYDLSTWYKINNAIETPSNARGTYGRIPLGEAGSGDVTSGQKPAVIKDDNIYKLIYNGQNANITVYSATMQQDPITLSPDTNIKIAGTASQKIELGKINTDARTVGLWHMDETIGSGTTVISDSSGLRLHGTIISGSDPTPIPGIAGYARNFDGSTDYISVSNTEPLNLTTGITIEAWFYANTITGEVFPPIIKKMGATSGYSLELSSSNSTIGFWAYISGAFRNASSSSAVSTNQWHHGAGTYDGSTMKVYLDGLLVGTTAIAGTMATANTTLNFGRDDLNAGRFFNGIIDEIRISNAARTPEEIAESYKLGKDRKISLNISSTDLTSSQKLPFYIAADRPGNYLELSVNETPYVVGQGDTGLVLHYTLDQVGNSTESGFVKDESQSAYNGTLSTGNSQPTFTQGKIGGARYFDGNDLIDSGRDISYTVNDSFSMSFWFNTSTLGTGSTVYAIMGKQGCEWFWRHNAGEVNGIDFAYTDSTCNTNPIFLSTGNNSIITNKWYHIAVSFDATADTARMFLNGVLIQTQTGITTAFRNLTDNFIIGNVLVGSYTPYSGIIDEVKISNIARSAQEIRQEYELGKRSHPITIDFAAKLDVTLAGTTDGSGLLTNTAPTIDATTYGAQNKGSNLYAHDKLIIKENYNGTEYIAQGNVYSVTSGGAVVLSSWDTGSSFPPLGTSVCGGSDTHCFTTNASVFKWQREYFDLTGIMTGIGGTDPQNQRNAITNLTLRVTNGNEGRTIFIDDARYTTNYITSSPYSSFGESNQTSDQRFVQYRSIFSTTDTKVSPTLTIVNLDYSAGPTLTQLMRHGKWFNFGAEQPFWWVN